MHQHDERQRTPLGFVLAATAAMVAGLPAAAGAQAPRLVEEIVVTGSRIARDPNLGSAGPIQTVSAEDITLSGQMDVTDVLRFVPSLLTSTSAESSVDGVFRTSASSVGQSVLALRGMGTDRTLVLVDGRRHVSGVEGSQAVDVGSIPQGLIERVEVLTGGASSIYGADAVTGVVNFILKDDFEGMQIDANSGISGERDGQTYRFSALFGENFADGRGNATFSIDAGKRHYIRFQDRNRSRNNGLARSQNNPARRFQAGDIDAALMPNFAQFYSIDEGRFPYGFGIPSESGFVNSFTNAFGNAPTLTPAEQALIQRASDAPVRAILRQPTFSISSALGAIAPADFDLSGLDLDGNGVDDCLDSYVGYLYSNCWVVDPGGNVRPFRDGLVASGANQFGGDGIPDYIDRGRLVPDEEKLALNATFRFDLTERLRIFGEAKLVTQEVEWGDPLNTFYDLLYIAPDNPFIPAELADLAVERDGLFMNRDPVDLGPNLDLNRRETRRVVLGIEGEFTNGWNYELSANRGEFQRLFEDRNRVIQDRWFASFDVITGPNGQPICRSDVDPTPPPTADFPYSDPGFFTFNPGDGQCRPANILAGPGAISGQAVDFITTTVTNDFRTEQTVLSGFFGGQLDYFELPGGKISFVLGAEYREEKSSSKFDALVRGELPVTTEFGEQGQLVRDLGLAQTSLVFDPTVLANNSSGEYDVGELFVEFSFPLLADTFMARELTLDAAGRWSDYSTVGTTTTWSLGLSWSPVDDVRFRGTLSEAIRAPNIFELFDPEQGAVFRPIDPCDQSVLNALQSAGDPRAPIRDANCRADGLPVGYEDPLTARFSGVVSGNENLSEETAESFTIGMVLQPRFLDGLTLSVDYWNIKIEDAIEAVSSQDIVNNCYDSPGFPNQYCGLFTRNRDPASQTFLGFNFLRQTRVNFGKIESAGVDFAVRYEFDIGANEFSTGVSGSWVDMLDYFFDPGDPSALDPELKEIQRPEWAGTFDLQWRRGPLQVGWQTFYMSKQGLRGVEIEDYRINFGNAGIEGAFYSHDMNFSYDWNESMLIYGGINNVTDEEPFITEQVYPVNPRGRYFFLGVTYSR